MYEILQEAMHDKKIKQKDVAERLGIHYNTVCAKIAGKRDFTFPEAKLIHDLWFSDIDIETLLLSMTKQVTHVACYLLNNS